MGSNWLGMALCKDKRGLADKIVASACMQCPMKVRETYFNLKAAWNGLITYCLSLRFKKVVVQNMDYLYPIYKQQYDFDLKHFMTNLKGAHEFDDYLNWRLTGCVDLADYHHKYSTAKYLN